MKETIQVLLTNAGNILWLIATMIIFIVSFYFSFKLNFAHLNFKKMFKYFLKKEDNTKGLNSFKTLMLSLAGRIGIGSIAGVALAIYLGGPGTVFWIWFISFVSAILAFVETYLGIKYKTKDGKTYFKGGPTYYIKDGLKKPKLGGFYAACILLTYLFGSMTIQSNTIAKVTSEITGISPVFIGIGVGIISFIVIVSGLKKISDVTSKMVPIMSLVYVLLALIVIIINIEKIPSIFNLIIKNAFNIKSSLYGFLSVFIIGVQRGIFSSEAGLGTGSIAASSGNSSDPEKEGYIQSLGIYITSLIICSSTAFIVLLSGYQNLNVPDPNGIEIVIYAFKYHLGTLGNLILIFSIFCFAFSTILSGYYYEEVSLKYLLKNIQKKHLFLLKITAGTTIFLGSITSSTIIWKVTDIFMATLIIINSYAIFMLKDEIKVKNHFIKSKKCNIINTIGDFKMSKNEIKEKKNINYGAIIAIVIVVAMIIVLVVFGTKNIGKNPKLSPNDKSYTFTNKITKVKISYIESFENLDAPKSEIILEDKDIPKDLLEAFETLRESELVIPKEIDTKILLEIQITSKKETTTYVMVNEEVCDLTTSKCYTTATDKNIASIIYKITSANKKAKLEQNTENVETSEQENTDNEENN